VMYERIVTRDVEDTHPRCAEMFNKSNSILQEFFPFLKFYIIVGEYTCLCLNCILIILGMLATLKMRDTW
jgi:hypothetical protein